jgi:hypothetical protein
MKDKFEASMVIAKLGKKYGGYYRHTFYQNLIDPVAASSPSLILANGEDIETQMKILDSEEGMIGCLMQKNDGIMQVGYAKANHRLF